MKLLKSFCIIFLSILSSATQAAVTTHNGNSWFVGAGIGRSWLNLSNNSTSVANGSFAPAPYNVDYFTVKTPSPQSQAQVDIGYRWHKDRKYIPYYALLLQYRHYLSTYVKGNVYQYSQPEFENYNYQMQYFADLLTLNGKINLFEYKSIMPYLALGVGFVCNHLNNYAETPLANVTPRTNPGYSGNTNTNFAMTLGLGVDVKLTKNVWATLGYEYLAQQNNISTGNGSNTWSGTKLVFGKEAKMNTIFLNISANIPESISRSDA
jgi:opacity protein-like surface antigen